MLAFDNSTEENYRIFFMGGAGRRHHKEEEVAFLDRDGSTHNTGRCTIVLSESPRGALVAGHSLVKCQPCGWLAFGSAPTESDCEVAAFSEQTFVAFLNGEKVPFYWADRRIAQNTIRRSYFGWVRAHRKDRQKVVHQPLPIMDGIEVFTFGEEVLSRLPKLFQIFVEKSRLFDFGSALWPLWTALGGVLQDRLALAAVSLERTATMWEGCRTNMLKRPLPSDASVWRMKSLLKSLRRALKHQLEQTLGADARKRMWLRRVIDALLVRIAAFVKADACGSLTDKEVTELKEVVVARIDNITKMPNSARLRQPFEDLKIALSAEEIEAIDERNAALHGRQKGDPLELRSLDVSVEYFDRLRMLITKVVLKICEYEGPYIDYASRPPVGNFEVKKL